MRDLKWNTTTVNKLRPIPNLPDYWAADDGTVWRFHNGDLAPVKTHLKKNGYVGVNIKTSDGWKVEYLHALILLGFVGPRPDPKMVCRHLDGDRQNCRPDNLAYGTHSDNTRDRVAHGRSLAGVRNPASKLNPTLAFCIREASALGVPRKAIAERYGVHDSTVKSVLDGKRWVDDPAPPLSA